MLMLYQEDFLSLPYQPSSIVQMEFVENIQEKEIWILYMAIYQTKVGRMKSHWLGTFSLMVSVCQLFHIFLHFRARCNYFTNISLKKKGLIPMPLMDSIS